eukprot:5303256-Alexandrium_andersonii.AAC.1
MAQSFFFEWLARGTRARDQACIPELSGRPESASPFAFRLESESRVCRACRLASASPVALPAR